MKVLAPLLLALVVNLAAAQEVVRPELGKPLQAAQEAAKAGKYDEALARLREADAVPNLTPHEAFLIARLRGFSALGAGDTATAIQAFELVANASETQPDELQRTLEALANTAYRAKDYPKATAAVERYFKAGGTSDALRVMLAQSRYLQGDVAGAARDLTALIAADDAAKRATPEIQLRLLANCQQQLKDEAGYVATLERLLAAYPKPDYWADRLARVARQPGFAERLVLDVYRLKAATGNFSDADAVQMAKLALLAGLPGEAKKVVGDRDAALRQQAERQAAADKMGPAEENAARAAKDGNALFNLGYAMASGGDVAKGLPLMEQGLAKGSLKRLDDAKLHLGLTQALAGRKDDAKQTLASVQGSDGASDLARLWSLTLR
jgi:tetratricopeptide repeat protein